MGTLPALLPASPNLHHLRWADRLTIGSIRSAFIRLAQSVALSGTASLIVVAAQHCVIGSTFPLPRADAPKPGAALAESALRLQPELPAATAVMTAPVVEGPAPAPSRQFLAVSAEPDAGRTRPTEAWVPLPPRPPIRAAVDHGVVALAAPVRNTIAPEPASPGLAAAPRLVRTATAVPLPPLRATLVQARPPISHASRTSAGAPITAGRPLVLAAVTAPDVPPSARHPLGDAQFLVAPVRYGMRLALGVGDFVTATNDRLISGTTDAISSFVR